ncbi:uncharacterized protein LOC142341417 isoform X2 [Convolutriloba macropyga]|uniref:uncharacterized protein LOC142341417 isoform X2 n=1 Tax=Convolutriloba macropyga TaxID=536237 RepID=UPI003F51C415
MHKYEISDVENRNQDHDTSKGSIENANRKVVETSFSWSPEENEHNGESNHNNKVSKLDNKPKNGIENQDIQTNSPKQDKNQSSSPEKSDKALRSQPESDRKMADTNVYSAPQGKLPKLPGQTNSIRADETTAPERKPSMPVARPAPGHYATTADNNYYGKVDYGKTGGGGNQYSGSNGKGGVGADYKDSGYGNTNSGYVKHDNDNNSDKGSGGSDKDQNGFTSGGGDKKGGMGGMKGYFRVPKRVVIAAGISIILLFLLVLLTAIILGVMMSSMSGDIDDLKEENDILRASIQSLRKDFNDSDNAVLLAQIEEVNVTVNELNQAVAAMNETLKATETDVSDQQKFMLGIQNVTGALDSNISTLAGAVNDNKNQIDTTSIKITGIEADISGIEADIAGIEADIALLQSQP